MPTITKCCDHGCGIPAVIRINNESLCRACAEAAGVCAECLDGKSTDVIIRDAPIAEQYWYPGKEAQLFGKQIRIGGCYFDFDDRWDVTFKEKTK